MKSTLMLLIWLTLQAAGFAQGPASSTSGVLLPGATEPSAPATLPDIPPEAVIGVAGGTLGVSRLLDITPSCPCARTDIPRFDRWGADFKSGKANVASHLLLGVSLVLPFALAATEERPNFGEDSLAFAEAIVLTYAVTEVTKHLADRPRPYVYGASTGPVLTEDRSYKSFFSGHASASFAAAAAYTRTGRSANSGVVFSVAGTTAGLRIFAGKHFLSDVLTGAAVGTFIGWVVPGFH